ncbi:MAG: hypothetical protein AABX39_06205 [Nanoarchaeota archaeon]
MNKTKFLGSLGAVLLVLVVLALSVTAQSVPVNLDKVEVNGVELNPWQSTSLSVQRNDQLEVRIELVAYGNADNLELQAFLSGYEYNDVERISASTAAFSVSDQRKYVKKLTLKLPENLEKDNYKLRLVLSDRNGPTLNWDYSLSIDVPRHRLRLEDVLLSPGSSVRAGDALLVKARLQNKGEKDERDVKVTASLGDLASQSAYLDRVKSEDEKETEELFLRVPKCTKAGVVSLKVDVEFSEGRQKLSAVRDVLIEANSACEEVKPAVIAPVVSTPAAQAPVVEDSTPDVSKMRKALEVVLLVLVALLVVVGLVIGFSKLRSEDDD